MGFIEFVWPASPGEWGAWLSAVIILFGGLVTFLMPRTIMGWTGLAQIPGRQFGLSEIRGPLGGFHMGIAFWTIAFHPQPLLYIALGTALALACLGRIVAFLFDGARSPMHMGAIVGDAVLAALPLLYAFGVIR